MENIELSVPLMLGVIVPCVLVKAPVQVLYRKYSTCKYAIYGKYRTVGVLAPPPKNKNL